MNPERLEAYHHLVKKLLAAPDQAAKILETQPTLVDPQLLEVMRQVSDQMKVEGFSKKAHFLRSLVAQLKEELIPSGKFNGDESKTNWNNERQQFNLRARKISKKGKIDRFNELEWETNARRFKWICLVMVIAFLILPVWVLFHRTSGGSVQDKKFPGFIQKPKGLTQILHLMSFF
ncbi:MAG: hypothetical protein AB4057_14855 [Crocosphaera sp.]